jgi:PIN domain nuclease of toxin-antitoxin system
VRLLLDSNIILPVVRNEHGKLGAQINLLLNVASNDIFVSVASIWEIAIKARLGKLPLKSPLQQLPDTIAAYGYTLISVDHHHAVADLFDQPATRDPFDRMLLAQCQVERLRLVTTDGALVDHPLAWQPA